MHCACAFTSQLSWCKATRTSTAARSARRSRTATQFAPKRHWFLRCSQSSESEQPEPDASTDEVQPLQDWRSFRANLVALERANSALTVELSNSSKVRPCWVHELTQPEAGCLLVAKLESMGTFTHTAVLLCQHDALGSSGFIINMPLSQNLLDVSTDLQLTDSLQEKQLFLGGPCSTGAANVLHTCDIVQGATQIVEGLHVGGLEDVNRLSRLGQIEMGNVQVLVGCTAWNPGQLQKEIWLGCWHVLAASNDVLHECLFGGMFLNICALQATSSNVSFQSLCWACTVASKHSVRTWNRCAGHALLPASILYELGMLLAQLKASLIAKSHSLLCTCRPM